jgi:multiple sugar transport system substrate-binding protein
MERRDERVRKLLGLGIFFLLPAMALAAPKQTVVFWHSVEYEGHKRIFDAVVKRFNAKHKDIRVEITAVPGEMLRDVTNISKLMNAVSSGTGPDVYRLDRFTVSERAALKLIENIEPFLSKDDDIQKQFVDFAFRESQFRGKLYAIPDNIDARALFYRKDILRESGVESSEFDAARGPLSLNRFREILGKVTKTDSAGNLERVGLMLGKDQNFLHFTWGLASGGVFASESSCEVTPENSGVKAGFEFGMSYLKSLGGAGKVQHFVKRFGEGGEFEKEHPFVTGRTVFSVNGPWILKQLSEKLKPEQWGVTYIPSSQNKKWSWSGGWSYVVPKGAKNPKGALEFIRFLSAPETQRELVREMGILPSQKSVLESPPKISKEMDFFFKLLPVSQPRPLLPVSVMYWNELTAVQERVLTDEKYDTKLLEADLLAVREKVQRRLQRYCR